MQPRDAGTVGTLAEGVEVDLHVGTGAERTSAEPAALEDGGMHASADEAANTEGRRKLLRPRRPDGLTAAPQAATAVDPALDHRSGAQGEHASDSDALREDLGSEGARDGSSREASPVPSEADEEMEDTADVPIEVPGAGPWPTVVASRTGTPKASQNTHVLCLMLSRRFRAPMRNRFQTPLLNDAN
jgi:hypothetical protein